MKRYSTKNIFSRMVASLVIVSLFGNWQLNGSASAQGVGNDILYTTDADFEQGTLVSVNHNAPDNNQLQLDSLTRPFPFINVAASGRGTVVRSNTETGEIVGEYRTAPEGRGLNPSRTTVDLFGNVWTANRDEAGTLGGVPHGSAVKIGLIVGGTRADETGSPDPAGSYLAAPYGYNTCVDRNGDGLIRTSKGLGDILDWPDLTDGSGGTDGLVQDAVDECILIYQRLPDAEGARHVSVDADNNVWVGGYPYALRMFHKLDGTSGALLDSFDAREIGCGGYGGLIDGNGILWSVGEELLRYDPVTRTGSCIRQYGYGLGIDTNGYIWMSLWDGGLVKIAPDGTVVPGFPKPTYPPSMMTLSLAAPDTSDRMAASAQNEPTASLPPLHEDTSVPLGSGDEQVQSLSRNELEAAFEPLAEDPSVTFWVAPVDEWVQASSPWTPGATITLTIEDSGGVVYSTSQTADGGGYFNFNLWDVFDIQRGQVVTVSDGTTTKTHIVADLFVDGVDHAADTVFGRAEAGASVDVWVHGNGGSTVTTDGSGNWTADFSAMGDLTYLSDGGSRQYDGDGDSTGVWWSSPQIRVAPVDNWVQSTRPWTPGTTITLTIEEGGAVVYSDSQTANADGNFNFNLWDMFDIQRGQAVTVSDGTITKTHTVTNLYPEGVDLAADVVFGRADAGTDVAVWLNGPGGFHVTTNGSGNWTADFSGITDLDYLSDGSTEQTDADGDITWVSWDAPRFEVAPEDNWVESRNRWIPESTITLTIEDAGTVVYSDSQTATRQGYFYFGLWDVFDLQRGQVVTVSDGVTTKTHTVMNHYVDGVDITADTVFGRADPGTDVEVWVHGDGGLVTTTDGSGDWAADFSGMTDLTYLSDGGSRQIDSDGDSTGVWWDSPRFQVSPDDEWVQSWNRWTPETTISLTIEEGGAVVYSDSQVTDPNGNFHFSLWDVFDLQRGQVVTVSDGTTTKTHTVADLFVDRVSVGTDTVLGRADPGTDVRVQVNGSGDNLIVTADGAGNWTADFSGMTDLTYLSDGNAEQIDSDGDGTNLWWSGPRIQVAPEDDWVQSWSRWTPGTTISLTIADGGGVVYSDSQTADASGNFNFNLWDVFDLQRGQVVTVSDGTETKTHTVMDLYVDNVDITADTIFGRAEPGTDVGVWVHGYGDNLNVTADGSGNWTADFSGTIDLTYLSDGSTQQFDSDGDATGVWWASPRIQVAPEDDWVQSWNHWTPGATISLTIEEGGAVVYSDSQTADSNGNFNFNLWDVFDLERGQVVTVSDGTNTKTHTVMDLYVDSVDVTTDTLSGRAEPDSDVEVWVHGDGNRNVTADGSGNWTVDFSGLTDLTYLSDGGSQQWDDDGDATGVWWAGPGFQVSPDDNWVQSSDRWRPGTTVSLTIEDGGAVVYSDSQTVDARGNFFFNVSGIDLEPGHQVTVSDGTTLKTHTVIDIQVDDIDADADQIRGTAAIPGAEIWVWVNLFDEGSGRSATADSSGAWVVDFSVAGDGQPLYDITNITRVNVNESDDDGDSTYDQFGPAIQQNRGVAVTAVDNNVWVASSGYGTVTRFDNDGNIIKVIDTGLEPTGVAIDAAGKVWAANMVSNNAVRIDPNAGSDGLGAIDLTVDLGPDAWPYNYSDMTGTVVVGSTSPQGFWTVVQDSQTAGVEWGRIIWNTEAEGNEPLGTAIVVEARAADTEAGLGGETFLPILNGDLFSMSGRFIEVRATLKASPGGVSPVLSDIRIQPKMLNVDIDIKPRSFPNSINCKNKHEVITVAILTTEVFNALTVDHTTVTFEGASEIHINWWTDRPIRHVEDVDRDGDKDLVFHFRLRDTALTCGSKTGKLIGLTYDGIPFEGTDSVRMINSCKSR